MSEKKDFRPVKVKIKSNKQKSMKYISGDLLYSGVNLFGKLSEIYMEKIKNGEMFAGTYQDTPTQKEAVAVPAPDYSTPAMSKKSSTVSNTSNMSYDSNRGMLKSSSVFQMDQEIMSLFRKLQKKDAITKVKALKGLLKYVEDQGEEIEGFDFAEQGSQLSQVLTFFLYHFERIVTYEAERGVRKAAHDVLGAFLKTCKRNFNQHIINLFPLWYISFYDTAQGIRTTAKDNFFSVFKSNEIRSNLFRKTIDNIGALKSESETTISQNYLYFIQEKILHFEMLLSEDMTTLDKAERDSIYDRIISGCLESLSDSFDIFASLKEGQKKKSWTPENTTEYIDQILDVFNLNSVDSYPTMYKFMGAKFSPPIRAAALRLLVKVSDYMIKADKANKEIFTTHIHKLSSSLFSGVSDESYNVQKILWKSVLYEFCSIFKDELWEQVDIKKALLPQIYTCLKNAGFGAHTDLYKNFSHFVSLLPIFNFETPFETLYKTQPLGEKKSAAEPIEESKEESKEEVKETPKEAKKKKKAKKARNQGGEGGVKTIKNSFSINEKANVMFETMKALLSGIDVEEAVAFNKEIIDSYYDTIGFLCVKRIFPAIETLKDSDPKSVETLKKKSVQSLMLPVSEYLKKNNPKLSNSLYNTIPEKFTGILELFSSQGLAEEVLDDLFNDIHETLVIGLEKSPQNTIKLLSILLSQTSTENAYYIRIQKIGSGLVQSLYKGLREGLGKMSKETIDQFEKDIEIFSYISHSLLTKGLESSIFELYSDEIINGNAMPHEYTLLVNIFEIVKILQKKLKKEFLQTLEIVQEKMWLCLILRTNYLYKRGTTEVEAFMNGPMLDLISTSLKNYGISDDRYLRFVIQYIAPADCLSLLISENIEKKVDLKRFKKNILSHKDTKLKELFIPYETFMQKSEKIQEKFLSILYIDMIDDYSKSHQIMTIYSIFKRKLDEYVSFKQDGQSYSIFTEATVKTILESTLEFLEETEQVHKSFQLSEIGNVLAKFILSIKRDDNLFELSKKICESFFTILLDIKQNLSSAVDQWKFINSILMNEELNFEGQFLEYIENVLKQRIHNLAGINSEDRKYSIDLKSVNNEILVLKNFINTVPKEKINLLDSLSRIVLHQENFSLLAKDCLILKIFQQTFLIGGIGFNIDDLALKKEEGSEDFKYIWLLCELLTSSYLPSLAGYTNLRYQIQTFCEAEVYPLILRECCSESNNTLFFSMMKYLTQKSIEKSSIYAKTLGNIIQMIIKPPEGLYELVADFTRWKDLLDVTIGQHLDSVLQADDSNIPEIRRKIEMIKIVSDSVKHLLYSLESYQDIREKIIAELDVNKESNIILYSTMIDDQRWDSSALQFLDNEDIDETPTFKDVRCLQSILNHISGLLDEKIDNLASLDSILESLNCALTKMGIGNILDSFAINFENIKFFLKNALDYLIVEEITLEESSEIDTYTPVVLNTIGINLLQFVKMIIGQLHSNDSEGTNVIIDGVFEYSKLKAEAFTQKTNLLKVKLQEAQKFSHKTQKSLIKEAEEESDGSKIIQEQEYELIDCIAEVINNIIPYIHTAIDEDVLYTLIGTHIESIQKAAYLTLKYFYESFIPPLKYKYEEEGEIDEEEFKHQIEQELAQNEESKEDEEETKDDHDQVEHLKQRRIKGEPDKNISIMLLDIIERPPEIKDEAHQHQDEEELEESEEEILHEGYMNIQSSSTLLDDKLMSNEVYSYFLAWNAMLNKISNAKMKLKFEQDHDYLRTINSLQEFLTMNQHVYEMLLILIIAYLPSSIKNKWNPSNIIDCKPEWTDLNEQKLIEEFGLFTMYNFMANFPSLARDYYQDCDRRIFTLVHPIISKLISPAIMENEIRKIETSQADLSTQNLSFTLFKSTQEILADYVNEEVEVQLKLKIPNEYPLKSIEVKCTKQLKIPEMKLRRWMLSISKMISSQNGDFISGILLWKSNIEKEIEGVEDCLICYSTVHVIDKSLPKLACKNCENKFHAHCIRKWFAESQKSKCPMCQSFFW
ncbi:unnamed protein product [Moneuplotes crassus]|uniref:E3 ubiquitin-protein ligase listerin n=2 Tax=Euplotes crassus TaxID=5936 RepID=A0AAD1XXD0_EUPCR|nr:unnamed protein product [Moneuplotes crassus]